MKNRTIVAILGFLDWALGPCRSRIGEGAVACVPGPGDGASSIANAGLAEAAVFKD